MVLLEVDHRMGKVQNIQERANTNSPLVFSSSTGPQRTVEVEEMEG